MHRHLVQVCEVVKTDFWLRYKKEISDESDGRPHQVCFAREVDDLPANVVSMKRTIGDTIACGLGGRKTRTLTCS
jgi:hypothetical protein